MIFKGNGVVWDADRGKMLCSFPKDGDLETNDEYVIKKLTMLGYEVVDDGKNKKEKPVIEEPEPEVIEEVIVEEVVEEKPKRGRKKKVEEPELVDAGDLTDWGTGNE